MLSVSGTASDAGVNVDMTGLHATCSLHPSTNLTYLLTSLPADTMVNILLFRHLFKDFQPVMHPDR